MPEGRLIRRKIADNERLNSLPVEARLLYDRLILFVDREARHKAIPRLLLRRYFPLDDYTDEQMLGWLKGLHDAKKTDENGHKYGLIELYEVDELQYLWLPGFEGEQSKSWSNPTHGTKWKEAESSIPEPPASSPSKKKSDIKLSPKLQEMIDFFEDKIGRPATPKELEQLRDMSSTYELDSFKGAVEEAVRLNKRNLTYIERILESKQEPEPEEPTSEEESGEVPLE